jgi:ATP:ADP antiporter, AAA family
MFKRIAEAVWGKFESREEIQKFLILAFNFCLIIAVYWALRPIKDSGFMAIVGGELLWKAKIVSLFVITPLVIIYSKLVDMFPRHKVFYALLSIYALAAFFFAWAFMQPDIGFANTVASPSRMIGWAWYVYVESFGSLIITLFWAITTDVTLPDAARRGFPLIALVGQFGNAVGPAILNAQFLGFDNSAPIVAILGILILCSALLMWIFFHVTPKHLLTGYKQPGAVHAESEPGFLEGLKLLVTKGYLLGIFVIITLYELIITVVDYHFKQAVFAEFPTEKATSAYLSSYATYVGIVATLCVLFGINNIQRRLGMLASLILLPILVALAILLLWWYPSALNLACWIMIFSKAVNYALNQPTMKQLYIPTSHDTKYKAQAWIEMFGSRGSKALSSLINGTRGVLGIPLFFTLFSMGGLSLIVGWLFVALYVAKTYDKAIAHNRIVC